MTWLALLLACASPARAQLAQGGPYALDMSVAAPGGPELAGGAYTGRAAAAQAGVATAWPASFSEGGGFRVRTGFYNPPPLTLSASSANVVALGGSASVAIPADAVAARTYDAAVNDPTAGSARVLPGMIDDANRKLALREGGGSRVLGNPWEINLVDEEGFQNMLAVPATLTFGYPDADGDGVIDGTFPPARVNTLSVRMLDEASGLWVRVHGVTLDRASRSVRVDVPHFSVYAVVAALDTAVDAAYAYPVPFRPNGPEAGNGVGQTGTEAAGITFTNLPAEGTIEIYTLAGALVRRLDIPANLLLPKHSWDARNSAGQPVASGVYIWRVRSRDAAKNGRLMVIR